MDEFHEWFRKQTTPRQPEEFGSRGEVKSAPLPEKGNPNEHWVRAGKIEFSEANRSKTVRDRWERRFTLIEAPEPNERLTQEAIKSAQQRLVEILFPPDEALWEKYPKPTPLPEQTVGEQWETRANLPPEVARAKNEQVRRLMDNLPLAPPPKR